METLSPLNPCVVFDGYAPPSLRRLPEKSAVLLLVPGCNQSGKTAFLAPGSEWIPFADRENLVLLTPSFRTSPEELRRREGYYYPARWSGEAAEEALRQLAARYSVDARRIALFGFSAGAHFAHRFAEWKPDRVVAFAAYSAAWWDEPTDHLARVPALIMCGEDDVRFEATLAYFQRGNALGHPWLWRAYRNTGHEAAAEAMEMARVFLRHYLRKGAEGPQIGDIQTYKVYPMEQLEDIPASCRVILPSAQVAAAWTRERR
ncbi:MAG TPA: PHB depolymerase family esterase [Chthoniobacterales bacterium]